MAFSDYLNTYQNFTVTVAKYPEALALPYLGLGLGDEAGELLEKITTMAEDGRSVIWGRANVMPEVGDVLWYLAQLLLKRNILLGRVYDEAMRAAPVYAANIIAAGVEVSIAASRLQGRLKKEIRDNADVDAEVVVCAARILRALDTICRWFNSNVMEAAMANKDKLEGRAVRGTIHGEGDVR